ncbi:Uncharacterised protein [Enterobacter hormaechei]|uniref:hypothetical protein n=1 Tax=Enterobacter hormaechei TaxID=158836 RepID=UPI001257A99E|nr:hypothetical protein [Enterobacter hormaechei]VAE21735.1 Uncharacterised protein [Enterobacter hormaechei]VAE26730.1 Uncharacterised protein [Enterobacter hormaechei]
MNKKERDKLAHLTADLIYSFQSMPEAVGTGQRILREFPDIESDVQEYRNIIALTNIGTAINNALLSALDNGRNTRDLAVLHRAVSSCLMDCVDDYMSTVAGEENHEELYALEREIGDSTDDDVWEIIGPLVHAPEWPIVVGVYHAPDSPEYHYLTFNQTQDDC